MSAMFLGGAFMATYYEAKGLTHTQVYLLQVILYLVSMTTDMPFGRLADRFGNKMVMIVGASIALVQSIYFASCNTFWQFTIALVGTGLYLAAFNNATHAAMDFSVNTVGNKAKSQKLYNTYLTYETIAFWLGHAGGLSIGGLLYIQWGMRAPYVVQPIVFVLMLILAWQFTQPPQPALEQKGIRRPSLIRVALITLRDMPKIRSIAYLSAFSKSVTLTTLWVIQPRMAMAGIPVRSYPLAYIAAALFTALAVGVSARLVQARSYWLWVTVVVMHCGCLAVAGMTSGVAGVIGLFLIMTIDTVLALRLTSIFLRESLPEDRQNRNTQLGLVSTIGTIAAAACGPLFGLCVDLYGLRQSLNGFALIALAWGVLALRSFKRTTA